MTKVSNSAPTCRKCGVPLTDDNWRPSSRVRGNRECTNCQRAYYRSWLEKNPNHPRGRVSKQFAPAAGSIDCAACHRVRKLISDARKKAQRDGLAFDLDGHFFDLLQRALTGECERTGHGLDFRDDFGAWSAQLARIDANGGWVYSNVQLVALAVDADRLGLTEAEFQDLCNKVAARSAVS